MIQISRCRCALTLVCLFATLHLGVEPLAAEDNVTLVEGANGFALTTNDLKNRIQRLSPAARNTYSSPSGQAEYLDEVVRVHLFSSEAKRLGFLDDPLIADHVTDVVDALLAHYYVQREIFDSIQVTKPEIATYFAEHRDEFYVPAEVVAPSILIPLPASATDEESRQAQALAQNIVSRLRAGGDIETLREEYSHESAKLHDFDAHPKASFHPDVAEIVFALDVGEVSDPIPVDGGLRIFKVVHKQQGRAAQLDEVEPVIAEVLRSDERVAEFSRVESQLTDKYDIQFHGRAEGQGASTEPRN